MAGRRPAPLRCPTALQADLAGRSPQPANTRLHVRVLCTHHFVHAPMPAACPDERHRQGKVACMSKISAFLSPTCPRPAACPDERRCTRGRRHGKVACTSTRTHHHKSTRPPSRAGILQGLSQRGPVEDATSSPMCVYTHTHTHTHTHTQTHTQTQLYRPRLFTNLSIYIHTHMYKYA